MINIVEILKDCPKGMELDCTMHEDVVTFYGISNSYIYPILVSTKRGDTISLTKYGQFFNSDGFKCVIFPKGKTTWEGFQRPFKDGDVVVSKSGCWIGIVKSYNKYDKTYDVYVAFENWRENYINIHVDIKLEFSRLATEEEKEKFFKAIKDNGYQWDPETKTLYKPEFKDGDVVINDRGNIFIYKGLLYNDKNRVDFYCGYLTNEHAFVIKDSKDSHFGSIDSLRLATEEEKQILFDAIERQKLFYDIEKEKQFYAIKDNGYQWDPETKTLYKSKFKDGDVCTGKVSGSRNLVIFIYKERINTTIIKSHFTLVGACKNCYIYLKDEEIRFATEEEKQRLFHVIKENGYHWNNETKTLESLIEPKFKIGDRIRHKLTGKVYEVSSFLSNGYGSGVYEIGIINELIVKIIDIKEQGNYELLPNKFIITTLKPFDKVLVRDENGQKWMCDIFSYYDDTNPKYPFWSVGRSNSKQCIPYKGNEHLLGTTNDCDEFYKNW